MEAPVPTVDRMSKANTNSSELLDYAKQQHRSGKRDEANQIYARILNKEPENVEALRLTAVVSMETGDPDTCKKLLLNALKISPENASVYNNFGNLLHSQKKYDLAVDHFEIALKLNPDFSQAANNLGNSLRALGRNKEAIKNYQLALDLDPELPQAWNNLGNLMSDFQQKTEAENCFLKALTLDPNYKDAWNNLGICYANSERIESALNAYDHAISFDENFSLALNNKGNLFLQSNRFKDALDCFEHATKNGAHLAEAWNGCGYAHRSLGHLQEAVDCFKKSIEIEHNYAEAWNNLGLTYADQGLLESALNAFRKALRIRPDYIRCHSNQLLFLNYLPDLHEKTLFEAHEHWGVTHQKYPERIDLEMNSTSSRALRIGFVSADFCRHPISYFILPVLRYIPSDKYEVYCYSNRAMEDDLTQVVKQHCTGWRKIVHANDEEVVTLIRGDQIDVLFDLSGHTDGNRLTAFSLKPAPLQISWLGYPHTTGIDAMDAVLSDAINLPEYIHWMFTEKIEHLPHSKCCYAAPDYAPAIGNLPVKDNGFVTFGSFNNPVKLNKKIFTLWSKILQQCKNSILILSWKTLSDRSIAERIIAEFSKHNIAKKRIKLLGGTRAHEQVFIDYNRVDIALDTYPFSGGLTSCEALWMGAPVITLAGKRPASRQTAALLAEIGLDELICFKPDEYVDCAVNLANEPLRLQKIRESLRADIAASSLGDGEKFTTDFVQTITRLYNKKRQLLTSAG